MQMQSQQAAIEANKAATLETLQAESELDVQNYSAKKQIDAQFEGVKTDLRTQNQVAVQNVKAYHKSNEKAMDAALGIK
jgi:histidinol dehydrogenase